MLCGNLSNFRNIIGNQHTITNVTAEETKRHVPLHIRYERINWIDVFIPSSFPINRVHTLRLPNQETKIRIFPS